MTAPDTSYDLSSDAHIFVRPPFGKMTVHAGHETYGVLHTVTELVDLGDGVVERKLTTVQVVKGALGDVPPDAHITRDGRRYRVLTVRDHDSGWFDLLDVADAGPAAAPVEPEP